MAAAGTFMFDFIRNHRRWMQFILLILILPSFVFVGVQGYTSFVSNEPEVAVVGGEPITQQEFDWALRNQLEQYRNMLGGQFDAAALDTPAMREALLNQLIDQRVVAKTAIDGRLMASDEALRRAIAAQPELQENGSFSPDRYREFLLGRGMTAPMFESSLRSDMILARVLSPVGESAKLPAQVAQRLQAALDERRTVRTRTFPASDYRGQVQVSDADIKAWYDANPSQMQVPAYVRAEYVVLDEKAAQQGVSAPKEEDVAAYYEQNKNRFGEPERRHASHILVNGAGAESRAKAEALAQQAAANPDGFAELARANSQDGGTADKGGDLGWVGRGMLVGPLEDAIFGLQAGQVSGVVQSQYGFHVVRVTEISAGKFKPLAEVRGQVEEEIRKQLAASRFAEMAGKLTNLVYDQRDSLQPVVDGLGLELRSAEGIARDGLLGADQAGKDAASASNDAERLNDPRVRQALFSTDVQRDRLNSGVIELDPGSMIVVRVADVRPARVPELSEVAEQIRERLVYERAVAAAREAGEAFVKAARAAPDAEASLAAMSEPETVSRRAPGALPQNALVEAMRAPASPLPGYAGVQEGEDYVAVRIDAVEAAPPASQAELDGLRAELSAAWGRAEEAAVLKMLREQNRAQIQPAARSVLEAREDGAS